MKKIICTHPIKWIKETKKQGVFKVYCEIDKKEFEVNSMDIINQMSREYSRDWDELLYTRRLNSQSE